MIFHRRPEGVSGRPQGLAASRTEPYRAAELADVDWTKGVHRGMLDLQQIWASYLHFFSIVHFQIDDREVGSCQKVDSGEKDPPGRQRKKQLFCAVPSFLNANHATERLLAVRSVEEGFCKE
jgi:hypothetical protein